MHLSVCICLQQHTLATAAAFSNILSVISSSNSRRIQLQQQQNLCLSKHPQHQQHLLTCSP